MMEMLGAPLWLVFLAFLGFSIILASVRNDLVEAIGEAVNTLAGGIDQAADWLSSPHKRRASATAGLERAVLYMALFWLVGPADVVMMADRVATLLGVAETPLPGGVGVLMGIAVIFGEVIYTLAYLDLAAKVPPAPWDELPEPILEFLQRHVMHLAIALTLTTGGLFLWGALAVSGIYFDALGWLLTLALGVQIAGAAALAFAVGRGALTVILTSVLAVLGGMLQLVVAFLDKVAGTATKLIDMGEATGRRVWDWFATSAIGHLLNLKPMPPRQPRPRIGRESKDWSPLQEEEGKDTVKVSPRYSLVGLGKVGADIALLVPSVDVAWGAHDKDRPAAGLTSPPAMLNGCVNVSPTKSALAGGLDAVVAEMFTRAGDIHVEKQVTHGVTTVIADGPEAHEQHEDRQERRFPDERFVLVSNITNHGDCQRGKTSVLNLHYDLASALIAAMSYERFVAVFASVIDALQIAAGQYDQNLAYGQVAELLGQVGGCFGLRSHSEICAAGKLVPFFGPALKRVSGYTPAFGDAGDILNRAITTCQAALTSKASSAVQADVDQSRPFAAVFRLPLPPRHPEFAPVVRALDSWLRQNHPQAYGVYASGNGVAADPTSTKERWVQCSILFPLSDEQPLAKVRSRRAAAK